MEAERRDGHQQGFPLGGGVSNAVVAVNKHKNAATCLARDLECRKRRKKRHWERKCFSKAIREADGAEMNFKTLKALRPKRKREVPQRPLKSPGGILDIMRQFTASTYSQQPIG